MPVLFPEDPTMLAHFLPTYDPLKAHEYYLRTRELKGRKKGSAEDPRTGKDMGQIHRDAKATQRKELAQRIADLQVRLVKLEELIKKREHEAASENRKSKAKKERAAKEKDKPKSAAEKAEIERNNKKYRDKHKQELKTKSKQDSGKSGGGGGKDKGSSTKKHSTSELKVLATKVRGQITVAKQKLAAL